MVNFLRNVIFKVFDIRFKCFDSFGCDFAGRQGPLIPKGFFNQDVACFFKFV